MNKWFLPTLAAVLITCVCWNESIAQEPCKKGEKRGADGKCYPICKRGEWIGDDNKCRSLPPKTCSISVSIGVKATGVLVKITETRKYTRRRAGVDDVRTDRQRTNEQGEVEFKGLNCSYIYEIAPQSDEKNSHYFDPPTRKFLKLKPRETATFTALPRQPETEKKPKEPPCEKRASASKLDLRYHSDSYSNNEKITTASFCDPADKTYYDEYEFTTAADGQTFAVDISSPDLAVLDLELSDGKQSISRSQLSPDQNSQTLQWKLPHAGVYVIRVSGKAPDKSYTLSIKNNGLTDAGYENQIEKIRSSLAGNENLRSIFDAVNKQISTYRYKQQEWGLKEKGVAPIPPTDQQIAAARSKLEDSKSSLELLEKLAGPARTKTYTLLAIVYRAIGGNYIEAQNKALEGNGEVRFRVRLSESRGDESRMRYWLLIRKGGVAFELLEPTSYSKLLNDNFSRVPDQKLINTKNGSEVEIRNAKNQRRYIVPISKATNEATEISVLLGQHVVKGNK